MDPKYISVQLSDCLHQFVTLRLFLTFENYEISALLMSLNTNNLLRIFLQYFSLIQTTLVSPLDWNKFLTIINLFNTKLLSLIDAGAIGPRQANLVLIAYASSKGSGCASAQARQNLRCSLRQAVNEEEPSDRKPDPWPLWMAGHAQLKFVMTECLKTQSRLTGLNWCGCMIGGDMTKKRKMKEWDCIHQRSDWSQGIEETYL